MGIKNRGKIVCVEVTPDTSLCVVPMKFPRTLLESIRIGAPLTAVVVS
jgi:hypothetical protein